MCSRRITKITDSDPLLAAVSESLEHQSTPTHIIMSLRDWRQALSTPLTYRVGNSTFRIQIHLMCAVAVACLFFALTVWYSVSSRLLKERVNLKFRFDNDLLITNSRFTYNNTYPISSPIVGPFGIKYRIGIISDMDTDSLSASEPHTWVSYFKKGHLIWDPVKHTVAVIWDPEQPIVLKSTLSQGGRGMELSELVVFNGKLYALDDRTGVIYEIEGSKVVPWVMLSNGNGRMSKGFKSEWAAVKDESMYVGGLGKEWTSPKGVLENYDPMWIKSVTPSGEVSHHNWKHKYMKLRESVGIEFPGYMLHECAMWSAHHNKWFFLPRRVSKNPYDEDTDPYQGTNLLLTTDPYFSNVEVTKIGHVVPTHGFSSFKFIPGTKDNVIVALKTEELKAGSSTYVLVFTVAGEVLLPETKIAQLKYEGIEFI